MSAGPGRTSTRRTAIAPTALAMLAPFGVAVLIGASVLLVAGSPARAQIRPDLPGPDEAPAASGASAAEDTGSSPLVLAGLGAGGLIVGLAAGWVLGSRRRDGAAGRDVAAGTISSGPGSDGAAAPLDLHRAPATTHLAGPEVPTGSGPASSAGPEGQRDQLVRTLIEVADMVSSDAVRTHLVRGLEQVGVTADLPAPGTPFDATRHRGVQAVPAPDPTRDATVASCDRPGWTDGDRILRTPEVVVHRWEEQP